MVLEKKSIHNKLMNYIKDIKSRYKKGNIVERIIYINSIIFIFTLFISVIQELYKIEINGILKWFALDHNFSILLSKPWTIISYGFLHADFIHLLLNLITLNFIGNLFIEYFTQKQLLTFYLLGTFFGGILYLLSHNYFPLFEEILDRACTPMRSHCCSYCACITYFTLQRVLIRARTFTLVVLICACTGTADGRSIIPTVTISFPSIQPNEVIHIPVFTNQSS